MPLLHTSNATVVGRQVSIIHTETLKGSKSLHARANPGVGDNEHIGSLSQQPSLVVGGSAFRLVVGVGSSRGEDAL
jgi:hypothetical protein